MSRDNGGVPRKVTENVGYGLVERGGGMTGTTTDQAVKRAAGNPAIVATPRETDQSKYRTPYGSTIQAGQGTEKDMGGVGDNKGTNGPANDFRQPHP